MMTQFFAQLGTLAYFSLKRSEIAAEFCINKDKPASCCHGKCYLGKQLGGLEHRQDKESGIQEQELPYFEIPDNYMVFNSPIEHLLHFGFVVSYLQSGYSRIGQQPPELATV